MINNFKLTGEIHNDIPTVCEAIKYTKALVDGLVEEAMGKMDIKEHPRNTALFVDMLELQKKMVQALACSDCLGWDEKRRFYGPLANRDYLFIGKYD